MPTGEDGFTTTSGRLERNGRNSRQRRCRCSARARQYQYKTETGGAVAEEELPLRLLVTGDFTGRPDATPVEERKPINIDKNNFDEVLQSQRVGLKTQIDNTLSGGKGDQQRGSALQQHERL